MKLAKISRERFSIFILSCVVSAYYTFITCKQYAQLSFDNQIILTWHFTSALEMLPYKDIYYPYGFLFYLKNSNVLAAFAYFLLFPLCMLCVFISLEKVWKDRVLVYITFCSFFMFVLYFASFDNFLRYGIVCCAAIILSLLFSSRTILSLRSAFIIGLLQSIVFILIPDQGIYILFLYFCLLGCTTIAQKNNYWDKIRYFLLRATLTISAFIVSLIPQLVYLYHISIGQSFILSLLRIGEFPIYAKTPFIPYSYTIENIVTFSALFFSILYITSHFLKEKKLSFLSLLIISFTFILVVLEQKSFIRSVDRQITFISFLLFVYLFSVLYQFLCTVGIPRKKLALYNILVVITVFTSLGLHRQENNAYSYYPKAFHTNSEYTSNKTAACLETNKRSLLSTNKTFKDIQEFIQTQGKGTIFVYLSDPFFYVLFNQKPPYYLSIFESSPLYAQQQNIAYIEKNNVQYVIYNEDITQLQDGVPSYARSPLLFKYVLTHFSPYKKIGSYIIFKRRKDTEELFSDMATIAPTFTKTLLTVNLANIPRSEGIHKTNINFFAKTSTLVSDTSVASINSFLASNVTSTENLYLLITPDKHIEKKEIMVTLTTDKNKTTEVIFYPCEKNKSCIVHVSNIPLFYVPHMLKKIKISPDIDGNISLVNITDTHFFW